MGAGDQLSKGRGDGLAGKPLHLASCALCEVHLEEYRQHMAACACHHKGCLRMGLPFESHQGSTFARSHHSKERVLKGDSGPLVDSE